MRIQLLVLALIAAAIDPWRRFVEPRKGSAGHARQRSSIRIESIFEPAERQDYRV